MLKELVTLSTKKSSESRAGLTTSFATSFNPTHKWSLSADSQKDKVCAAISNRSSSNVLGVGYQLPENAFLIRRLQFGVRWPKWDRLLSSTVQSSFEKHHILCRHKAEPEFARTRWTVPNRPGSTYYPPISIDSPSSFARKYRICPSNSLEFCRRKQILPTPERVRLLAISRSNCKADKKTICVSANFWMKYSPKKPSNRFSRLFSIWLWIWSRLIDKMTNRLFY